MQDRLRNRSSANENRNASAARSFRSCSWINLSTSFGDAMWASLPRESRLWFTWWRGPKTRAPSAPEHPTFTVNMVMFIFRIQKWFPKKAENPGESMRKSHPPKYIVLAHATPNRSFASEVPSAQTSESGSWKWEKPWHVHWSPQKKQGPLHFWTCGMGKKK